MVQLLLEHWKPVVGFEGQFIVSCCGRVKRVRTRYGNPCNRDMKLNLATSGYHRVSVSVGVNTVPYVHTLVAAAFFGPRPAGLQINHRDGNKLNNRASNLEYVTCQQNLEHAARLGLSANSRSFKLTAESVRDLRERYKTVRSHKLLAAEFGVDPSNVYRAVTGRNWKHIK